MRKGSHGGADVHWSSCKGPFIIIFLGLVLLVMSCSRPLTRMVTNHPTGTVHPKRTLNVSSSTSLERNLPDGRQRPRNGGNVEESSSARQRMPPDLRDGNDGNAIEEAKDYFGMGPPVVITQGQHVSSPPHAGDCSCWNTTAKKGCCERIIHANHKFGYFLVVFTLFGARGGRYGRPGLEAKGRGFRSDYFTRPVDYREVFVTRNWYDALISGYLYHKSGHECWLDPRGESMLKGVLVTNKARSARRKYNLNPKRVKLEPNITLGIGGGDVLPPVRGRNVCRYLAEESEEDGMRVYIKWVIEKYYRVSVRIFKAVQQREDPRHRRTLFVCYEELNDPSTREATIRRIMDWMYPGGGYGDLPPPRVENEYQGGHSTSHDPDLRGRLRSLVRRLDATVFGGAVGNSSALFGCGSH